MLSDTQIQRNLKQINTFTIKGLACQLANPFYTQKVAREKMCSDGVDIPQSVGEGDTPHSF